MGPTRGVPWFAPQPRGALVPRQDGVRSVEKVLRNCGVHILQRHHEVREERRRGGEEWRAVSVEGWEGIVDERQLVGRRAEQSIQRKHGSRIAEAL